MTSTETLLSSLFDKVPADLVAYFDQISDGTLTGRGKSEVNLLPLADAIRWTNDFRGFHPIVEVLGGVILDDPNTSNHHVYLSTEPCAGSVLYLCHDGDSYIMFATLASFVNAARLAIERGQYLSDLHPETGVLLADQAALSQLVAALHNGEFNCDATMVILSLIPSMDLSDLSLLENLARDDDFYIAEAVADAIARRPRRELKRIAMICERHPHSQASRAGVRATSAIAAL
jgi:hypothetical protein